MKLKITRDNLQQGLAAVGASIPTRTTLPVLSNILIEVGEDSISMSGTDLDIAVSVNVPADVDEPGALTVPAKKLQELARELPEHPVRITTKGDRLELTCGRATFRLNGMPRDEFPTFPTVDFANSWKVGGKVLHELIRQTSFAVSTEESRPILNGVLWQLGESEMRMVATNGHRLARIRVASEATGAPKADLIVPPKALAQVERLFSADDEIEVARSENHIGFRKDGTQVFTRLIEGPYPNYEQVIPKDNDKHAIADRNQLVQALRRMAVVASDQTHRVRLGFTTNAVRFSVVRQAFHQGGNHWHLDGIATPGFFPRLQRQYHRGGCQGRGVSGAQRQRREARVQAQQHAVEAHVGEGTAGRGDHGFGGFPLAAQAVVAGEARHRQGDQLRAHLAQLGEVDSQALHDAWPEALDDDVGLLDQGEGLSQAGCALQVQAQRTFVAVQHGIGRMIPLWAFRWIDVHDGGAQVGQGHGHGRCGNLLTEIYYANTG
jgi:DNA polymerase-3 subunit beta